MSVTVDDAMYSWGGFAYPSSNPSGQHIFDEGFRLARGPDGTWQWTALPPLPFAVADAGMCAIGSTVYLHGGADFSAQEVFCYDSLCNGSAHGLGRMLHSLDTAKLGQGASWQTLPSCPGTPRAWHQANCVGGKVYVMGGSSNQMKNASSSTFKINQPTIANVVDNWAFDTSSGTWSRLRDLPSSGSVFGGAGGGSVFQEQKIVLINAFQYDRVRASIQSGKEGDREEEQIRAPYGVVTHAPTAAAPVFGWPSGLVQGSGSAGGLYYNDVFVYDVASNAFGYGDGLPINNASPDQIQLNGTSLLLVGGETGGGFIGGQFFGWHPDLVMLATMREA